MKKNKVLIAVVLAVGAYLLLNQKKGSTTNTTTTLDQRDVSQEPTKPLPGASIQQVQNFLLSMISLYGAVDWLWQPGGPLYGRDRNQDLQTINANPDTYNSGYA